MNLLYSIFVRPIELGLGLLFGAFVGTTGNYGCSLLLMSLSVTLAVAPLYYVAERWKRMDDEIKALMAREIKSVKRHYEGQKQFYLIRNVHRLYGYNPWYALRASFGLLVQIPFFFGAYELLSKNEGLKGQAFLFLSDLGKPDGLLGFANLLPFIMTAMNLASSFVYNRTISFRKNGNLILMALLFLVLLFRSPSALLLYWISNNFLSLLKNTFMPAKRALQSREVEEPGILNVAFSSVKSLYGGSLTRPAMYALLFLSCAMQSWWLIERVESYEYCLALTLALAAGFTLAAIVLCVRKRELKGFGKLLPLAAIWVLFAASGYVLLFERRQNSSISNLNIKALSTFLLDFAAFAGALVVTGVPARSSDRNLGQEEGRRNLLIVAGGSTVFALFVFILSPLQVYFSSPRDVAMSPMELVGGNLPSFLLMAIAGTAIALLCRKNGNGKIAAAVVAMFLAAFSYRFISSGRFGVLDEFALEKDFLLESASAGLFLLDAAILTAALVLGKYLVEKKNKLVISGIALVLAAGATQTVLAATNGSKDGYKASPGPVAGKLPDGSTEAHRFSLKGRNVVFVIADMFNGNYLGRILEERPDYAKTFSGFTWYPNTLSAASHTAASLPFLYGGKDYTPESYLSSHENGLERLRSAAERFYGNFRAAGFALTAVDTLYVDPADFGAKVLRSEDYERYWNERKGSVSAHLDENPKGILLAMLSVFNAAPNFLKPRIYDEGSWIVFRRSYQFDYIARRTAKTYGYLDLLPRLSSTAESGDRLILIHTQFPHEPYGVRADGSIIEGDFPDPKTRSFVDKRSAYYTARKFVDFMAAWISWMKESGVYDNSVIIVVADHGNNVDDHDIALPADLDNPLDRTNLSRARVLLLVKKSNENGDLKTDGRLMSNADVPSILFNTIANATFGPDPTAPGARERTSLDYYRLLDTWKHLLEGADARFTKYSLYGRMDDPSAWKKE
ncbi:MAG: hypothetical protein A2Z96_03125 [Spirochaetes bacterium GWB1_48_6]|nr:MAG: hypothetical protein A2Z96_03125 [Spirochaetes bacterium GWB1_48_6]OHE65707.1 MAG: hypothetical protein A2001_14925 [Treponema sp. GWC1_61_84]HCM25993.1 hypothetical protein [Treponema sp.]